MKPGDTVQLKSGGPVMTIENVTDGVAMCSWFNRDSDGGWSQNQWNRFNVAALQHAEPEL